MEKTTLTTGKTLLISGPASLVLIEGEAEILGAPLEKEERILDRDWSKYDRQNIVFRPRHFTPEGLQDRILWAYRQTYNWRSLWDRRPFSFQHISLYLALNFGYIKGIRKMERDAKKRRKQVLPVSLPAENS